MDSTVLDSVYKETAEVTVLTVVKDDVGLHVLTEKSVLFFLACLFTVVNNLVNFALFFLQ